MGDTNPETIPTNQSDAVPHTSGAVGEEVGDGSPDLQGGGSSRPETEEIKVTRKRAKKSLETDVKVKVTKTDEMIPPAGNENEVQIKETRGRKKKEPQIEKQMSLPASEGETGFKSDLQTPRTQGASSSSETPETGNKVRKSGRKSNALDRVRAEERSVSPRSNVGSDVSDTKSLNFDDQPQTPEIEKQEPEPIVNPPKKSDKKSKKQTEPEKVTLPDGQNHFENPGPSEVSKRGGRKSTVEPIRDEEVNHLGNEDTESTSNNRSTRASQRKSIVAKKLADVEVVDQHPHMIEPEPEPAIESKRAGGKKSKVLKKFVEPVDDQQEDPQTTESNKPELEPTSIVPKRVSGRKSIASKTTANPETPNGQSDNPNILSSTEKTEPDAINVSERNNKKLDTLKNPEQENSEPMDLDQQETKPTKRVSSRKSNASKKPVEPDDIQLANSQTVDSDKQKAEPIVVNAPKRSSRKSNALKPVEAAVDQMEKSEKINSEKREQDPNINLPKRGGRQSSVNKKKAEPDVANILKENPDAVDKQDDPDPKRTGGRKSNGVKKPSKPEKETDASADVNWLNKMEGKSNASKKQSQQEMEVDQPEDLVVGGDLELEPTANLPKKGGRKSKAFKKPAAEEGSVQDQSEAKTEDEPHQLVTKKGRKSNASKLKPVETKEANDHLENPDPSEAEKSDIEQMANVPKRAGRKSNVSTKPVEPEAVQDSPENPNGIDEQIPKISTEVTKRNGRKSNTAKKSNEETGAKTKSESSAKVPIVDQSENESKNSGKDQPDNLRRTRQRKSTPTDPRGMIEVTMSQVVADELSIEDIPTTEPPTTNTRNQRSVIKPTETKPENLQEDKKFRGRRSQLPKEPTSEIEQMSVDGSGDIDPETESNSRGTRSKRHSAARPELDDPRPSTSTGIFDQPDARKTRQGRKSAANFQSSNVAEPKIDTPDTMDTSLSKNQRGRRSNVVKVKHFVKDGPFVRDLNSAPGVHYDNSDLAVTLEEVARELQDLLKKDETKIEAETPKAKPDEEVATESFKNDLKSSEIVPEESEQNSSEELEPKPESDSSSSLKPVPEILPQNNGVQDQPENGKDLILVPGCKPASGPLTDSDDQPMQDLESKVESSTATVTESGDNKDHKGSSENKKDAIKKEPAKQRKSARRSQAIQEPKPESQNAELGLESKESEQPEPESVAANTLPTNLNAETKSQKDFKKNKRGGRRSVAVDKSNERGVAKEEVVEPQVKEDEVVEPQVAEDERKETGVDSTPHPKLQSEKVEQSQTEPTPDQGDVKMEGASLKTNSQPSPTTESQETKVPLARQSKQETKSTNESDVATKDAESPNVNDQPAKTEQSSHKAANNANKNRALKTKTSATTKSPKPKSESSSVATGRNKRSTKSGSSLNESLADSYIYDFDDDDSQNSGQSDYKPKRRKLSQSSNKTPEKAPAPIYDPMDSFDDIPALQINAPVRKSPISKVDSPAGASNTSVGRNLRVKKIINYALLEDGKSLSDSTPQLSDEEEYVGEDIADEDEEEDELGVDVRKEKFVVSPSNETRSAAKKRSASQSSQESTPLVATTRSRGGKKKLKSREDDQEESSYVNLQVSSMKEALDNLRDQLKDSESRNLELEQKLIKLTDANLQLDKDVSAVTYKSENVEKELASQKKKYETDLQEFETSKTNLVAMFNAFKLKTAELSQMKICSERVELESQKLKKEIDCHEVKIQAMSVYKNHFESIKSCLENVYTADAQTNETSNDFCNLTEAEIVENVSAILIDYIDCKKHLASEIDKNSERVAAQLKESSEANRQLEKKLSETIADRDKTILDLKTNVDAKEETLKELKQNLTKLESNKTTEVEHLKMDRANNIETIQKLKKETSAKESELNQTVQKLNAEIEDLKEKMKGGISERDELIATANAKTQSLEAELTSLKREIATKVAEMEVASLEIASLKREIATKIAEMEVASLEIASLKQEVATKLVEVEVASIEVAVLKEEKEKIEAIRKDDADQVKWARSHCLEVDKQVKSLETQIATEKDLNYQLHKTNEKLNDELKSRDETIKKHEKAIQKLDNVNKVATEEVAIHRKTAEESNKNLKALTEMCKSEMEKMELKLQEKDKEIESLKLEYSIQMDVNNLMKEVNSESELSLDPALEGLDPALEGQQHSINPFDKLA